MSNDWWEPPDTVSYRAAGRSKNPEVQALIQVLFKNKVLLLFLPKTWVALTLAPFRRLCNITSPNSPRFFSFCFVLGLLAAFWLFMRAESSSYYRTLYSFANFVPTFFTENLPSFFLLLVNASLPFALSYKKLPSKA